MGQKWEGAVLLVLVALAFHVWCIYSAVWIGLSAAVFTPMVIALCQKAGHQEESPNVWAVQKPMRETLRLFSISCALQLCVYPGRAHHRRAVQDASVRHVREHGLPVLAGP